MPSRRTRHDIAPAADGPLLDPAPACGSPGAPALLQACGRISLLPAHLQSESHPQMEGFQAEDRHTPLPHITLLTTAPKSIYKSTASLSTHTTAELRELLISGDWE